MNGESAQRIRTSELDPIADDLVGVTRLDLVCSPQIGATAQAFARRWSEDRAVSTWTADAMATLTLAAVGHGLRFGPRAVTIAIRWLDLDRIFVDVRWHGGSRVAVTLLSDCDLESTETVFDALADEWGFGVSSSGSNQWMVVDTR
jgi:hypothetical protein